MAQSSTSPNLRWRRHRPCGCDAYCLVAFALAAGVETVTHSEPWSAWFMAIGIDLGFIGMELASIVAMGEKVKRQVERYAKPAIATMLALSATMNASAFASGADNLGMQIGGCVLGVAIPAWIYALTRIGAALYIDTHNKH
jgi:hypothetical protein